MRDTAELKPAPQEDVQIDMRELFRGAVRMTLESVLEETVLELCGAARGVRGPRKDVRNGSYLRGLLTSMRHLEVTVPRTRNSGSAADVIGRYKRRTEELDDAITSVTPKTNRPKTTFFQCCTSFETAHCHGTCDKAG